MKSKKVISVVSTTMNVVTSLASFGEENMALNMSDWFREAKA
jgi:hypothetical protein